MRKKNLINNRRAINTVMSTILLTAITLAVVIPASLLSGRLTSAFIGFERIEIRNAYAVYSGGKYIVNIDYVNTGSASTSIDSIFLNGALYSHYSPPSMLGGSFGLLPSSCKTGVLKNGTIMISVGATDPSGNELITGVALTITLHTTNDKNYYTLLTLPAGGSFDSTTQGSSSITTNQDTIDTKIYDVMKTNETFNSTKPIKPLLDYASALRNPDGRINITRTVSAIRALNATGYDYLIWHNPCFPGTPHEWDDLPGFLAACPDLDIWVTLVPDKQLSPYGVDYVSWAKAIGTLSRIYPNLKGIEIDDFCYNFFPVIGSSGSASGLFNQSYMQKVYQTLKNANPNCKLLAGFYLSPPGRAGELTSDIWAVFGSCFDGVNEAHWYINQDNAYLIERLQTVRSIVGPTKIIRAMAYCNYPDSGPWIDNAVNNNGNLKPSENLLKGWINIMYNNSDIVCTYVVPIDPSFSRWAEWCWINKLVNQEYTALPYH